MLDGRYLSDESPSLSKRLIRASRRMRELSRLRQIYDMLSTTRLRGNFGPVSIVSPASYPLRIIRCYRMVHTVRHITARACMERPALCF